MPVPGIGSTTRIRSEPSSRSRGRLCVFGDGEGDDTGRDLIALGKSLVSVKTERGRQLRRPLERYHR
jgi:hypothetical protein